MREALDAWTDFNVAMTGATAALAGLLIVAASVNITEIVKSRTLTSRLGTAIVSLVVAIAASALGLVPSVDAVSYGAWLLALSVIALAFQARTTWLIAGDPDPTDTARPVKYVVGFVAPTLFAVGSVLALLGSVGVALSLVAVGLLLAIAAAITVSWVSLVEVLR